MEFRHRCGLFLSIAVAICLFTPGVQSNTRKVTTILNYECETSGCPDNARLAYTKAVGAKNTLHYIYSAVGQLSLVALKTKIGATVHVNWTTSPPTLSLKPPSSKLYSFGVVFNNIVEYNDTEGDANLELKSNVLWNNYSISDLTWLPLKKTSNVKENLVVFKSEKDSGSFSFAFKVYDKDDRQNKLPHLMVNNNLTLMKFVIDGVSSSFRSSRFALAVSYITPNDSLFVLKSTKSLDDEYTPGVFRVSYWTNSFKNFKSFLQWKSVCYLSSSYERKNSTTVRHYSQYKDNNVTLENASLAYNFLKAGETNLSVESNYVSFGLAGDAKFYNKTQYIGWSAVLGFGNRPKETISVTAIIIIAVGLGLPVVFMMFGGVFLCWRKSRTNYTPVYGSISS